MEKFEKRDRSAKQEDPREKQNRNLPGQEESERVSSGQSGRPTEENPGEGVTSHYGSEPSQQERSEDKPSGEEAGDGGDEGVE